jgi:hypothetical protein
MSEYRHNHYVPIWYQQRFMLPGQHRYFRLDLKPEVVTSGKTKYSRHDVHEWSPERIFAQDDLYTTHWRGIANREMEKFFFGQLDNSAPRAFDFFASFEELKVDGEAVNALMIYMSVETADAEGARFIGGPDTQQLSERDANASATVPAAILRYLDRIGLADRRRV